MSFLQEYKYVEPTSGISVGLLFYATQVECAVFRVQFFVIQVERAIVIADDRGRPTGTGIVEFSRKNSFTMALDTINNGAFYISK